MSLSERLRHGARRQRHVQLERIDLAIAELRRRGDGGGDLVLIQDAAALWHRNLKRRHDLDRGNVVSRALRSHRFEDSGPRRGLFGQNFLALFWGEKATADQSLNHEPGGEVSSRPLDRSGGGGRGHDGSAYPLEARTAASTSASDVGRSATAAGAMPSLSRAAAVVGPMATNFARLSPEVSS